MPRSSSRAGSRFRQFRTARRIGLGRNLPQLGEVLGGPRIVQQLRGLGRAVDTAEAARLLLRGRFERRQRFGQLLRPRAASRRRAPAPARSAPARPRTSRSCPASPPLPASPPAPRPCCPRRTGSRPPPSASGCRPARPRRPASRRWWPAAPCPAGPPRRGPCRDRRSGRSRGRAQRTSSPECSAPRPAPRRGWWPRVHWPRSSA